MGAKAPQNRCIFLGLLRFAVVACSFLPHLIGTIKLKWLNRNFQDWEIK